jgi:hypothetical protein
MLQSNFSQKNEEQLRESALPYDKISLQRAQKMFSPRLQSNSQSGVQYLPFMPLFWTKPIKYRLFEKNKSFHLYFRPLERIMYNSAEDIR